MIALNNVQLNKLDNGISRSYYGVAFVIDNGQKWTPLLKSTTTIALSDNFPIMMPHTSFVRHYYVN